ncbi:MAG TPA: class C beta-lactamase [Pseudolabrys sp.]
MCTLVKLGMTAALVVFSIGSFSAPVRADDAGAIAAVADQSFKPLLDKYGVPGIAVAVTVDGHQYFFNYGVASKDKNTPVTNDTLFELGSISKTFNATLFGLAAVRGKIALNDHPGKFIPALRGSSIDEATLLNLGTYTAGGLPLQLPDSVKSDAGMIDYFRAWKSSAAPGALRRYSNPSIGLFGRITASALGDDYAKLVESEIFPKVGMRESYIHVPATAMARYAWGYSKSGVPVRVNSGVFDAEAYGVKASSADMVRYVEANIRPGVLEAPIPQAIEATHVGYFNTSEMAQGLGWEQYSYPVTLERLLAGNGDAMIFKSNAVTAITSPAPPSTPTLFNKTGSTNGFGAYVVFVPAKKIGLVILANKNLPNAARVTAAYQVLKRLDPSIVSTHGQ